MTFTGTALLKSLEGCRLHAYRDQAGVLTIGYGHTGPEVHEGLTWTQGQADEQLDSDVLRFVMGVSAAVTGEPLSDNQFSALVILAFNIGLMAFRGSSTLRDVRLGQYKQIPADIAKWNKIRDHSGVFVVDPGLVKRRQAEIDLWNNP